MSRSLAIAVTVVFGFLSVPRTASAQEQDSAANEDDAGGPGPAAEDWENHGLVGGDRPWAKGVSRSRRRAAARLFFEANKQLGEQFFKQAAETYREALKHWEHPAIHYNLSLALVNPAQPVGSSLWSSTWR
jgi:hypothetical protein